MLDRLTRILFSPKTKGIIFPLPRKIDTTFPKEKSVFLHRSWVRISEADDNSMTTWSNAPYNKGHSPDWIGILKRWFLRGGKKRSTREKHLGARTNINKLNPYMTPSPRESNLNHIVVLPRWGRWKMYSTETSSLVPLVSRQLDRWYIHDYCREHTALPFSPILLYWDVHRSCSLCSLFL